MSDSTSHVKLKQPRPADQLAQDRRRLKRHRFMAKLSVRAAAAKAGISSGYLSDLEHGFRSAGPDALNKIADAYGCDVSDLMPPDKPAGPSLRSPDSGEAEEEIPGAAAA